MTSAPNDLRDAALAHAAKGRPVFPCNPDANPEKGKKPLTKHGFKDATTDPDQIRDWWTRWPDALIGMPTGAASRCFVLDVDVDPATGKDGEESLRDLINGHAALPDTVEAITPRGGRHIYFRHPGVEVPCSTSKIGPALDIRGDGGYVILAPSRILDGRCYAWEGSSDPDEGVRAAEAPAWLLAKVCRGKAKEPPADQGHSTDAPIREGARNAFLASVAGAMRRKGMSAAAILAALLAENDARCSPPLYSDEVQRIAESVGRYRPEDQASDAPTAGSPKPPPAASLDISEDELAAAHLTPRCFVRDLLYADVAQCAGPGSTGKTTALIRVAISIALGLPIWGLEVVVRGWTLFVTAEDQRQRLVARLREVLAAMDLSAEQRAVVLRSFRIWDVTGQQAKLVRGEDGNIVLTRLADDIVEAYKDNPPALIVFDPLVSFGASEQAVNDNEQAIITAGRRIVNGLECCVLVIHHTGKENSREKTLDQYAGRGGSALADGCRMVMVMQRWGQGDKVNPPQACTPDPASSITVLARAKLSYSPPNLPLIWIKRTGFAFESFTDLPQTRGEVRAAKEDQLRRFLTSELAKGTYHSQKTAEDMAEDLGMSRADLRRALSGLRARMEVYDADLPKTLCRGGRKTYLAVANLADAPGEVDPSGPTPEPTDFAASTTSPPYREKNGGEVAAPFSPPPPCNLADQVGEVAARWRGKAEDNPTTNQPDAADFEGDFV